MKSFNTLLAFLIISLTFVIYCDGVGVGNEDKKADLPDYYFIINYLETW